VGLGGLENLLRYPGWNICLKETPSRARAMGLIGLGKIRIDKAVIFNYKYCHNDNTFSQVTLLASKSYEGLTSNTVILNLKNGFLKFNLETRFWVTIASPITCSPPPTHATHIPHTPTTTHTPHTHTPTHTRVGSGVAPAFFQD